MESRQQELALFARIVRRRGRGPYLSQPKRRLVMVPQPRFLPPEQLALRVLWLPSLRSVRPRSSPSFRVS
jgi:hypothetical protein